MRLDSLAPLRLYDDGNGTIAIIDAKDREVIHWSGFDSSALNNNAIKAEFGQQLVDAFNAAHKAKRPESARLKGAK